MKLSDYDQALLAQIGHFADTWLVEQVRAVMVARNNAEAQLAALSAALQPEPDEHKHAATFDAVLRCPNCMQTMRSERPEVDALMRSIEEYRNAPSSTASVPASLPVEPATEEQA